MSAASTSLDDDGGSTTSSENGGYLGIAGGQKQFPSSPHLGGKTMVGGKTIKSMGDSTDNDSDLDDDEENQNEEVSYEAEVEEEEEEEQSFEMNGEETEDEDDGFPLRKFPPASQKVPKQRVETTRITASQTHDADDAQQSQLEAWKEVHASLTKAVLVAREAIASKKLQRRFWLETICANLSHPSKAKSSSLSTSSSPPSQMPLLLPHSVWFKPDQRKKKRGSKKHPLGASEDPPKTKKARKTKATAIPNKTTLASLSGTLKKKVAKGGSLLKKRKLAMLPLAKGKTKASTKKKRMTAALPTKKKGGLANNAKPKIRLNLNSSKSIPPEAKVAAPVLSVFQEDSDDDSDTSNGGEEASAVAMAMDVNDDDESDGDNDALADEDEEDNDDTDQKSNSFYAFASNDDDDTSSEDENDENVVAAVIQDNDDENIDTREDSDPDEANSSENDGPDWNASQSSHPFLKKRRSSINNVGSTQGNLDSSEIYSTFRPEAASDEREEKGNEAEVEQGNTASSRMMGTMGGYGPFGGSDSSEDEIPF